MTVREFIQQMIVPLFILVASLEAVKHQGFLGKAVVIIVFGVAYMAFNLRHHLGQE